MFKVYAIRYCSFTFTQSHLRTIDDMHDWKRVIYKWVIWFRSLTPFWNRIVCRTIFDLIQIIICYYTNINQYTKWQHWRTLLAMYNLWNIFQLWYTNSLFPHLNMLKLNRFRLSCTHVKIMLLPSRIYIVSMLFINNVCVEYAKVSLFHI